MTTKYTKYLRLREWESMVNRFWYTLDEETDMIGPGRYQGLDQGFIYRTYGTQSNPEHMESSMDLLDY